MIIKALLATTLALVPLAACQPADRAPESVCEPLPKGPSPNDPTVTLYDFSGCLDKQETTLNEDEPGWDCRVHGNQICGKDEKGWIG